MTRQVPTTAEENQVLDDFDTFALPFDASLDLTAGASPRTVYGVTDTAVDLSMVNIRHLNDTRHFRGQWEVTPRDGTDPTADPEVPYRPGQIVVGDDRNFYMLNAGGNPATNPTTNGQTDWRRIGATNQEPATELTSAPESGTAALYNSQTQSIAFTVRPNANATPVNPTVAVTDSETTGAVTATISNQGRVDVMIPPGQTVARTVLITVEMESDSVNPPNDIVRHPGGQIDIPIMIADAREAPTVLPMEEIRANAISGLESTASTSRQVGWNIDIIPGNTSVAAGTAYDVGVNPDTLGNTIPGTSGESTFNPTPAIMNRTVTFNFPLLGSPMNGQVGSPDPIMRDIRVYRPWFWQFSDTAPTGHSGMTEAVVVGAAQADDFPITDDQEIQITGMTGTIGTLWLAVPTSVNRTITLNTGIAHVQSMTGGTFMSQDVTGGNIEYTLHRFRLGLVQSPTVFRIYSLPNS